MFTFIFIDQHYFAQVWKDRPAPPRSPVFVLDIKYAGLSFQEKLKKIQTHLKEKNFWGFVVSSLDEIAWLFNLRGSDIALYDIYLSF